MVNGLGLYKIFSEVVHYKNFSKAAKSLYMTQPAISQAISQLEAKLEVRLFTRTSRGVILTSEGDQLYEYISSALNLISVGENKIQASKNLSTGNLKIGVGDTISRYFLLPYLERFHSQYPKITLQIINRTTLELCQLLKSGKVDIAICNLPLQDGALEIQSCSKIHDVFLYGKNYMGEFKRPLDFKELMEFPLIFLEKKSNSRQYVEKYMLSKGVSIHPEIELGSHDLLLEFAKINLGIACVIEEFSQDYLQTGQLHKVPLKEQIPSRNIGYCFLKSVSLSPASSKFLEILASDKL